MGENNNSTSFMYIYIARFARSCAVGTYISDFRVHCVAACPTYTIFFFVVVAESAVLQHEISGKFRTSSAYIYRYLVPQMYFIFLKLVLQDRFFAV